MISDKMLLDALIMRHQRLVNELLEVNNHIMQIDPEFNFNDSVDIIRQQQISFEGNGDK